MLPIDADALPRIAKTLEISDAQVPAFEAAYRRFRALPRAWFDADLGHLTIVDPPHWSDYDRRWHGNSSLLRLEVGQSGITTSLQPFTTAQWRVALLRDDEPFRWCGRWQRHSPLSLSAFQGYEAWARRWGDGTFDAILHLKRIKAKRKAHYLHAGSRIVRAETFALHEQFKALQGLLDPQILRILNRCMCNYTQFYNWLAAGGNADLAQRRQRTAHTFPALFRLIARQIEFPFTQYAGAPGRANEDTPTFGFDGELAYDILDAIDRGQSIQQHLTRFYGLPIAPTRRLAHLTPQRVGAFLYPSETDLFRDLPAECLPVTRVQFKGAVNFIQRAQLHRVLGLAPKNLSRPVVTTLLREAARCGWAGDIDARNGGVSRAGLSDFLEQAFATDAPGRVAAMSARKLMTLSRQWHRELNLINAATTRRALPPEASCWEPLFTPVVIDGLALVPLTSGAALDEEGQLLMHCVGGYDVHCLYDSIHIISVRDATTGDRISTLELEVNFSDPPGKPPRIGVGQHLAFDNKPPPADAAKAVRQLIRKLRSGEIPIDEKTITERLAQREAAREASEALQREALRERNDAIAAMTRRLVAGAGG